jgi:hypothetical protein
MKKVFGNKSLSFMHGKGISSGARYVICTVKLDEENPKNAD